MLKDGDVWRAWAGARLRTLVSPGNLMPAAGQYLIVLAEDHVAFRQRIKMVLERDPQFLVVGEAGDGYELLEILQKTPAHLVLLDLTMPRLSGLEVIEPLRARHPETKILVLTMHKDPEYLERAMTAGAHGYLLKEEADTELVSAILAVRRGEIYVSAPLRD